MDLTNLYEKLHELKSKKIDLDYEIRKTETMIANAEVSSVNQYNMFD